MTTEFLTKFTNLPWFKQDAVLLQEISVVLYAYLDGDDSGIVPSDIKSDLDILVANKHPKADTNISGEVWQRIMKRLARKLKQYTENNPVVLETSYSSNYNWQYNPKDFADSLETR